MNQTFNLTPLAGDRMLITGQGNGENHQVIFNAMYHNELKRDHSLKLAGKEFDDAVEAFFAPLTEAAAKVEDAQKIQHDPAFMVVVQERQPGCDHTDEIVRMLDKETAVLRLIESGNTDRLIWVGDDIEVLALEDHNAEPVEVQNWAETVESIESAASVDLNDADDGGVKTDDPDHHR